MGTQRDGSGTASRFARALGDAAVRVGRWARRSPLAVDVLIAAGLAAACAPWTVWALVAEGTEPDLLGVPAAGSWLSVALAAVAVGHGALAVRRVRPLGSFLIVAVAVAVQATTMPWLLLPSILVVLPSFYSVAAYGRTVARGPVIGLVVALAGSLLVIGVWTVVAAAPSDIQPVGFGLFQLVPGPLAAWSLGMLRRARLAYASRLAELERNQHVRQAVAEQRNQIAREMHDVIAHALSVVISQANGGRYAARSDPDRAVEILTTIARTGQQALADTRGMLSMLRAAPEQDTGLPAVQPSLDDLPELVERFRAAGMSVRLDGFERIQRPGTGWGIGPAAELAAYRVVQESLTNTLKHAGPGASGAVYLDRDHDGLVVTVMDDGPGPPDPSAGRAEDRAEDQNEDWGNGRPGGQGLIGMRERVGAVSGSVSAGPAPGGGFRVRAWLPHRRGGDRRAEL